MASSPPDITSAEFAETLKASTALDSPKKHERKTGQKASKATLESEPPLITKATYL